MAMKTQQTHHLPSSQALSPAPVPRSAVQRFNKHGKLLPTSGPLHQLLPGTERLFFHEAYSSPPFHSITFSPKPLSSLPKTNKIHPRNIYCVLFFLFIMSCRYLPYHITVFYLLILLFPHTPDWPKCLCVPEKQTLLSFCSLCELGTPVPRPVPDTHMHSTNVRLIQRE